MSSTDSAYTDGMVNQMLVDLMSTTSSQLSLNSELSAPFQQWNHGDQSLGAQHFSPLWSLNGAKETPPLEQQIVAIRQELDTFRLSTTRRFDYMEARFSAQGPQGPQGAPGLQLPQDEIARLNSIIKELQEQDTRKENKKLKAKLEGCEVEVGRLEMTLEFEMECKRDLEAKVEGLEAKLKASKESEAKAKQDLQKSINSKSELQKSADFKIQSLQKSLDSMSEAKKSLEDGGSKTQNSLRQEIQNLKKLVQSESSTKSSLEFQVSHLQETLEGVSEIQKSMESEVDSLKKTLEMEQKEHQKQMEELEKEANQKIVDLENELKEVSSTAAPEPQVVSKLQKRIENQSKQYQELQKKSKQDTVTLGKVQKKLNEKDEDVRGLVNKVEEYMKKYREAREKQIEALEKLTVVMQENLKMKKMLSESEDGESGEKEDA